MNNHRFEFLLAAALIAGCAGVWHWQAPGQRLTHEQVTQYLEIIDRQLPVPPDEKAEAMARLRAFGDSDDGKPAYLVNLMRYFGTLRPDSGIPADFKGTTAEANARYESSISWLALKRGSLPLFVGNVHEPNVTPSAPDEENWNRIGVMRYPSRRAFFELVTDPAYATYLPFKLAALHIALVPAESDIVIPDVRFLTVAAALLVFLLAGWVRAVRRGAA